jgi:GNAT superfamily N-acetyltransferase
MMRRLWRAIGKLWLQFQRYFKSIFPVALLCFRGTKFVIIPATKDAVKELHEEQFNGMLKREFGHHEVSYPEKDDETTPQSLLLFETNSSNTLLVRPIGHVTIEKATRFQSKTLTNSEAERLLRIGVPEGSVRQLAKSKAVDYDGLMTMKEDNQEEDEGWAVSILGALVVEPTYRGLGLGKALAKAAVAWCVVINAKEVRALAATEELVLWYGRMGAKLDRDDSQIVANTTSKTPTIRSLSVDIHSLRGNSMDQNLVQLGVPKYVSMKRIYMMNR